MYRKVLIAVAAFIISAAAVSAQEASKEKFKRYNRWMVGIELVKDNHDAIGPGVTAVYGRQFSELIFLGVGFGTDMTIHNPGQSRLEITDKNGNTTIKEYGPYYYFLFPVYADLQVNLSRRQSPFFAEFKAGVAVDTDLTRVRGTESYCTYEWAGGGVLLGSGVGKRFKLKNDDNIDIKIGVDCIIGPFYANIPISLGVRYGF
ncbi:MAG: hypothetical protein E7114_03035 [Bacteroidales bacterium]|nr:hypothetical protein [Bacteroidales bacterium]MBO5074551.1 hypothetical protein [Bacteroidales bacterium]MBO5075776.1 hypothetical protein [Bacteroidales bacterium]